MAYIPSPLTLPHLCFQIWSETHRTTPTTPIFIKNISHSCHHHHHHSVFQTQAQLNQDMNLVLSTDAKPRLKWTPDLHQRFIEAIAQLGGADKATPKSLMRVMGIPGLTLYHLKSHLQKYRLGKSQQSENCSESYQEEYSSGSLSRGEIHVKPEINDGSVNQINESLQISQALQMQMEVQRKLHEQIEVQRHLQLRIEAQGKYLHSVLKKAQETLTGYNSTSAGVELAKSELSHLVSMVDTSFLDSSLSELTETGGSKIQQDLEKNLVTMGTRSSMESSLTSTESSGRKGDEERKFETGEAIHKHSPRPTLQLMEGSQASGRKRSGSTISDANCIELLQPAKRLASLDDQLRKYELLDKIDLNSRYQPTGVDSSGPKPGIIDLNCKGVEHFSGNL